MIALRAVRDRRIRHGLDRLETLDDVVAVPRRPADFGARPCTLDRILDEIQEKLRLGDALHLAELADEGHGAVALQLLVRNLTDLAANLIDHLVGRLRHKRNRRVELRHQELPLGARRLVHRFGLGLECLRQLHEIDDLGAADVLRLALVALEVRMRKLLVVPDGPPQAVAPVADLLHALLRVVRETGREVRQLGRRVGQALDRREIALRAVPLRAIGITLELGHDLPLLHRLLELAGLELVPGKTIVRSVGERMRRELLVVHQLTVVGHRLLNLSVRPLGRPTEEERRAGRLRIGIEFDRLGVEFDRLEGVLRLVQRVGLEERGPRQRLLGCRRDEFGVEPLPLVRRGTRTAAVQLLERALRTRAFTHRHLLEDLGRHVHVPVADTLRRHRRGARENANRQKLRLHSTTFPSRPE